MAPIPSSLLPFLYSYGNQPTMEDYNVIPPGVPLNLDMSESERAAAVRAELLAGNIAPHLLRLVRIAWDVTVGSGASRRRVHCELDVSPDWIGLGHEVFYLRTPLDPQSLQAAADRYDMMLATSVVVEEVHASAAIHSPFRAFSPAPGQSRNSWAFWLASNAAIEVNRHGRTDLLSDGKKDVIVGPMQLAAPTKVCIFGGWWPSGGMVQPASTIHARSYVDYSQCGRLMARVMTVDGVEYEVDRVAMDPVLYPCIVGSRAPRALRYPA